MRLEVTNEYMVIASQLMLIKSQSSCKVASDRLGGDDLEQDILSQIENTASSSSWVSTWRLAPRSGSVLLSANRVDLRDAGLLHDKTTIDLFLAFQISSQEKGSSLRITQLSCEMSIRLRTWWSWGVMTGQDQLRLQDLFKSPRIFQEVATLLAT